jgi:hypothetical protein
VHLENEALTIEDLEGRRWEEEVSRGGRWICRGDIADGVSATTRSNQEWKKSKAKTEDLLALLNS